MALSEKGKKSASKKPSTAAADEEPADMEQDPAAGGGPDPIQSAPPIDGGLQDDEPEGEEGEKPGDAQLAADDEEENADDAVDADGDGGEEPSGAVNDEIEGKTVQAVTIEPESQVLPGAKEVVVSFNETTDPLRILVTPTGETKFFWRGQIHDLP